MAVTDDVLVAEHKPSMLPSTSLPFEAGWMTVPKSHLVSTAVRVQWQLLVEFQAN